MFLNPERPGLPDIDTDFQHDKKDEVLSYIVKKYGEKNVAKIGTYTQMSSKLVLKDVARVLEIDHNWVNDLNKHLPVENGNVMPLEEAIVDVPEFVRANEKEPELFELASDLQSMPRNTSVHACFVGDTKIRTEDGMEDIINVSIGEMVLTHEGRYKPVTKTMVSKVDVLYELDVESYKKTKGTGDHPLYVSELKEIELNTLRNGKKVKVKALSQPVWKALKDLRPGLDYVYLPKKPGQDVKSEDVWPQESTKAESAYQINGNIWLQVKDVVEIELSESTKVYNLEVEDDHSYTANGLAVHNCGIQISPVPLDENIPLMSAVDRETKERQVVTQYEGGTLEDLGFVKFDILSLKNLTVMHIAVEEIERRHGVHIDINELEPEDPKVFETIKQGNTAGIFQLESPGMTEVFTGLEVVDFEALIAGVAMYR